ncbi:hypothetical protein WN943_013144 [Citrus x changshan-huyou]
MLFRLHQHSKSTQQCSNTAGPGVIGIAAIKTSASSESCQPFQQTHRAYKMFHIWLIAISVHAFENFKAAFNWSRRGTYICSAALQKGSHNLWTKMETFASERKPTSNLCSFPEITIE